MRHRLCCVFVTIRAAAAVPVCKRGVTVGNFGTIAREVRGASSRGGTVDHFYPQESSLGGTCRRRRARRPRRLRVRPDADRTSRPLPPAAPSTASSPAWSPTPADSTTSRSTSSASKASTRCIRRRWASSTVTVQSDSEADFAPNITSLIDQNCTLIITVGFALASAAGEAATPTPTSSSSRSTTSWTTTSTARPMPRTSSPSSSTPRRRRSSPATRRRRTPTAKKVGTFGGMNFPTVSIFMDGFAQGVEYWNAAEGRHGRGPRLGHRCPGRRLHRWLRRQPGRDQRGAGPRRPGRRRAPARRWTDLPERRIGDPRLRPRHRAASVSTPTCTRPTRRSPTCCSPRSARRSTWVSRRP